MPIRKKGFIGAITGNILMLIKILTVVSIVSFLLTLDIVARPISKQVFPLINISVSEITLKESARYLLITCVGLIVFLIGLVVIIPFMKYSLMVIGLFLIIYYGQLFLISLQKKKRVT